VEFELLANPLMAITNKAPNRVGLVRLETGYDEAGQ
jgi:hypothetical protein